MVIEPIQNKTEICDVCGGVANVLITSKNLRYFLCRNCLSEAPILLIQTRQELREIVNQFKSKHNKG